MMNKKLLCTAIGASFALGAGAVHAQAGANDWHSYYGLVPYVVKDANRTTVVSVMFTGHGDTDTQLHVQYWTKSTTDANTAACLPSSVFIPYTPNDMLTFDTAGILGYPLFGDTTNPAPLGASISYAAPRHGYLWLDANDTGDNDINAVYWMELDLANGGAHGDIANLPSSRDLTVTGTRVDGYVASRQDFSGTAVNFWPSSVVSTAFTVTPLGSNMLTRENNQVVVQVYNHEDVQGAYDRNENGVDGTVPITVRCVGRVTPAQLMPGVVTNAAWAATGGFGYLANVGDGDANNNETQGGTNSGDLDAIIYQIDTSSAGGKFMSNATRIPSILGSGGG